MQQDTNDQAMITKPIALNSCLMYILNLSEFVYLTLHAFFPLHVVYTH